VVFGLVQSHSGSIDVKSKPGQGTSVTLFFPVFKGAQEAETEKVQEEVKPVTGTETVLLVDDEPDLRYFVEMMLNLQGYRVLSAADGETALRLLENEPIQILFSDVGLPLMDGFDLNRRVRAIRPGIRTVLCSGYADAKLKSKLEEEGIDGFIAKPYDSASLLQIIRTILDMGPRPVDPARTHSA
jgi:DNA-binding NtrC family response regulator